MVALADDSGLSVAALDGRPGVYTADWAERQWFEGEPGRDWYMAMGKVEGMLQAKGAETPRDAWFTCVLALAWPDGEHAIYEGRVDGTLTWPPRGTLGFGYDPVFVPEGRELTFAELDPEEKHAHQPPRRCLRQAGRGAVRQGRLGRWPARSTSTGPSASPSARIATSTPMSASGIDVPAGSEAMLADMRARGGNGWRTKR